jgi:hypothetical protein
MLVMPPDSDPSATIASTPAFSAVTAWAAVETTWIT